MLDPNAQQRVALRLRRIAGQVRGVERMLTESRLCADLLTQISAVQSALKSVGDEILYFHVRQCVPDSFARRLRNSERERLAELEKIFAQYCREPRERGGSDSNGARPNRTRRVASQGKV